MDKIKILAVFVSMTFAACSPTEQKNDEQVAKVSQKEQMEIAPDSTVFGEPFPYEKAEDPQLVIGKLDYKDSIQTSLRGTVKEVCKAKGCWMTIDLGSGESMRVTFKDYGFFVPKDISGKEVVFQGTLKHTETDVATLRHYAEDEGKSKEEVLAIVAPEQSYSFVATGVKIASESSKN